MLNSCWEARAKTPFSNVTPVWLLPYMRLIKGTAKGDHAEAWKRLPMHLPQGEKLPSVQEAAIILLDHKLI